MSSSKKTLATTVLLGIGIVAVACSDGIYMGEVIGTDGGAPSFVPPSSDGGPDAASTPLLCIGTDCPAPWATCVDDDGPAYKCGTDLLHDQNHCGACGNKCLAYKPIHMISRCSEGQCELECFSPPPDFGKFDYRNCNALIDDGCETDVWRDPKNCGSCGNACAGDETCVEGKCGCPNGLLACPIGPGFVMCVDPNTDDFNCGKCGVQCKHPAGECEPPEEHNAYYGCKNAKCGVLKCKDQWADCNSDFGAPNCGGDGCEVPGLNTRDNCGACGVKCTGEGEECIDEGGGLKCGVPCVGLGLTLCSFECRDLLTDVQHCGACGAGCRPPGRNQKATCEKGVCAYECLPGFGDCNNDTSDGCETNLGVHPANCGACGNACNAAAGQPCVEGKCLMADCDAGVTK